MSPETIENIKIMWKLQTWRFDYFLHIKQSVVIWHVVFIVLSLVLCWIHPYIGLCTIPCMISWNYLLLFDRTRRAYKDSYFPQRYEYVGTIVATLIFSTIIIRFILT